MPGDVSVMSNYSHSIGYRSINLSTHNHSLSLLQASQDSDAEKTLYKYMWHILVDYVTTCTISEEVGLV